MRPGVLTLVWIGAMVLATYGCAGKSSGRTAPQSTSGGEAAVPESGDTSLGTAAPSAAEGAWGATRAEQCRREAHPSMSSKARKAFDDGVRYASTQSRRSRRPKWR